MAAKDVYRLTFTSSEILSILEAVTVPTVMASCNSDARSLINKLRKKAFEITNGLATPSYVTNGTKGTCISKLTVDDFGGYNDSVTEGANVAAALFSTGSSSNSEPAKLGAELDDSMEAELERLNAQMLAEVASNGAGSSNVILEERRKTPRNQEPLAAAIDITQL